MKSKRMKSPVVLVFGISALALLLVGVLFKGQTLTVTGNATGTLEFLNECQSSLGRCESAILNSDFIRYGESFCGEGTAWSKESSTCVILGAVKPISAKPTTEGP